MGRQHVSPRKLVDEIDRTICALVMRGHAAVLSYPWKLYLAAIDAANEIDRRPR